MTVLAFIRQERRHGCTFTQKQSKMTVTLKNNIVNVYLHQSLAIRNLTHITSVTIAGGTKMVCRGWPIGSVGCAIVCEPRNLNLLAIEVCSQIKQLDKFKPVAVRRSAVQIHGTQAISNDQARTTKGSPLLPHSYQPFSGQLPAPYGYGEEHFSSRYRYVAPDKAISLHPKSARV